MLLPSGNPTCTVPYTASIVGRPFLTVRIIKRHAIDLVSARNTIFALIHKSFFVVTAVYATINARTDLGAECHRQSHEGNTERKLTYVEWMIVELTICYCHPNYGLIIIARTNVAAMLSRG